MPLSHFLFHPIFFDLIELMNTKLLISTFNYIFHQFIRLYSTVSETFSPLLPLICYFYSSIFVLDINRICRKFNHVPLYYSPKFRILNHYTLWIQTIMIMVMNPRLLSQSRRAIWAVRNWSFVLLYISFWWTYVFLIREIVQSLFYTRVITTTPARGR